MSNQKKQIENENKIKQFLQIQELLSTNEGLNDLENSLADLN